MRVYQQKTGVGAPAFMRTAKFCNRRGSGSTSMSKLYALCYLVNKLKAPHWDRTPMQGEYAVKKIPQSSKNTRFAPAILIEEFIKLAATLQANL